MSYEAQFSKGKQTAYKKKRKYVKRAERDEKEGKSSPLVSENMLQKQLDEDVMVRNICFIRIPDAVWRIVKKYAREWEMKEASNCMAGRADTVLYEKVCKNYSLSCHIELKSDKGTLHGAQKYFAKYLPFHISRSSAKTDEIIQRFEKDVVKIREILKREGFDDA